MKTGNKTRLISVVTLVLAGILVFAGAALAVGTTLRTSGQFTSDMRTPELSIALLENDNEVSGDDALLKNLLGDDAALKIGKIYKEELAVANTEDTDQYIRMTVKKYWMEDEDGKRVDLSPDYIVLKSGSGWIEDEKAKEASSPERAVFYYTKPLKGGETSDPAITGIGLDKDVARIIERHESTSSDGKTITTTYTYDGLQFGIKVDVDGIQTHSAEDAAKSIWGVDISVANDGTLSLK